MPWRDIDVCATRSANLADHDHHAAGEVPEAAQQAVDTAQQASQVDRSRADHTLQR